MVSKVFFKLFFLNRILAPRGLPTHRRAAGGGPMPKTKKGKAASAKTAEATAPTCAICMHVPPAGQGHGGAIKPLGMQPSWWGTGTKGGAGAKHTKQPELRQGGDLIAQKGIFRYFEGHFNPKGWIYKPMGQPAYKAKIFGFDFPLIPGQFFGLALFWGVFNSCGGINLKCLLRAPTPAPGLPSSSLR